MIRRPPRSTLSLHDALPIYHVEASPTVKAVPEYVAASVAHVRQRRPSGRENYIRSEEQTSELQSQSNLVCRILLEKKKPERTPCSGTCRTHPLHPARHFHVA